MGDDEINAFGKTEIGPGGNNFDRKVSALGANLIDGAYRELSQLRLACELSST